MGAGLHAKQAVRWMAPAVPVFASKAGSYRGVVWFARFCRSGFSREAGDAVDGTGCAGVRQQGWLLPRCGVVCTVL